ncbi:MAG: hypothetical protein V4635_05990 [Bacteroidota bacterium]
MALGLLSCNNQPKQVDDTDIANSDTTLNDSSVGSPNDTLQGNAQQKTLIVLSSEKQPNISSKENSESKDSLIYFNDSHFADLGLVFKEISISQYKDCEKKNKRTCSIDTNGFVKGKGLILGHFCKDICESYLIDKKERIKLVLPCNYDQGIIGLEISPSCNQFIVYSSYDRPDYTEYYDYRAEIFGFTITQGQGFKIIKPSFKYYTKDWSIDKITWIDENTLALKLYDGERAGDGENLKFHYFKTNQKTK